MDGIEAAGRIMATGVRLNEDAVRLIIEASLQSRDNVFNPSQQAHFNHLRLVNNNVKAEAHRSFPAGVAYLAHRAVKLLLDEHVVAELPPAHFAARLQDAKAILREATELALFYNNARASTELVFDDPVWCAAAGTILREAVCLKKLFFDCQQKRLRLRGLQLERLDALEVLAITDGWKDQLHGLDLSRMPALRSFSMTAYQPLDTALLDNFSLPRQLVALNLSLTLSQAELLSLDIPSYSGLEELVLDLGNDVAAPIGLARLRKLRKFTCRGSQTVLREIAECQSLTELVLEDMALGSVADLKLNRNSTVALLDLSWKDLSDATELGLATNRSIVTLYVCGNTFSSFLFGLDTNTTLRNLDVGYGGSITADHFRQLSNQLSKNSTLERLDLNAMICTDAEVRELSLGGTSGLKIMDLSDNEDVGDDGVMPLLKSIEEHGLKISVDLSGTKVSPAVLERFRQAAL